MLDGKNGGRGTRQISPILDVYKLPWHLNDFRYATPVKGHISIASYIVNLLIFLSTSS